MGQDNSQLNSANRSWYLTERNKSLHAGDLAAFYTQILLSIYSSLLLTVIIVGFVHAGYARRMETKTPRGMVRREGAAEISVGPRWR